VKVNGETITRLGTTADPRNDRILVDGRPLSFPRAPVYILLHKPVGVVCTLKDPEGRPTVRDLLKSVRERVFPVGRLDYDSSGLLLLTNDGELTERLLHPRYQIPRTYHAKVIGTPPPEALQALRKGVRLDDGTITAPAEVSILRITYKKAWLEISLREGRNREVRRMCEAIGHRVEKLIRVRFGPLTLRNLPIGSYRLLTGEEVRALKRGAESPARKIRA
jgi:pseudouridine synthase